MLTERNGQYYGTALVLLSRVLDGSSEEIVGTRAPFASCVLVEEFEGRHYVEEPDGFWTRRGFTITESPLLLMARQAWFASKAKATS